MAKRIITTILQNYCGRYIDGISPDNIASVWSGEVSLKNYELSRRRWTFRTTNPRGDSQRDIGTLDAVVPTHRYLVSQLRLPFTMCF